MSLLPQQSCNDQSQSDSPSKPQLDQLLQNTSLLPSPNIRQSSSEVNAKPQLTLMQLVQAISKSLQSSKTPDLSTLRALMHNYDASLNEWRRFCTINPSKAYTRNLIATDQKTFTMMLLCWNPKAESMIHNHSNSECFMRVVNGDIIETQYNNVNPCSQLERAHSCEAVMSPIQIDDQCLSVRQCVKYMSGQVTFINDAIGLHKIQNPSDSISCTLHCYIPPYDRSLCYEVYENGKGISIKTGFVRFDSENGEPCQE